MRLGKDFCLLPIQDSVYNNIYSIYADLVVVLLAAP